MIKVLVVDDSKLIRALLTEIINASPELEVIGEAEDPYDAREKIKQLDPDVLTLDIEMPRMDGLTFLKNLMRLRPMPVVMLSTLTAEGAPITLEALELGAVDFLEKPKINVANELAKYTELLHEKLIVASRAHIYVPSQVEQDKRIQTKTQNWESLSFKINHLVAIGASTGGTEAIKEIITKLPSTFPAVIVTQHIPPVFSSTYAKRLDAAAKMVVHEAQDGQQIQSGHVYIAPGDRHLKVVKKGVHLYCQLDDGVKVNRHRPAVDVMFDSLDHTNAKNCTAVILTGMGMDGARGLLNLKTLGANTIAQNEETCVVYGMPRAAIELDAADKILPLEKIPQALVKAAIKV